jgi:hypothetical protein
MTSGFDKLDAAVIVIGSRGLSVLKRILEGSLSHEAVSATQTHLVREASRRGVELGERRPG